MQGERGNGGAVEGRAGVQGVIAQRVESAAMKLVAAGLGHHLDLHAAGGAALGGVDRRADAKLGDRVERDVEPRLRFLRLLLHAVVVDAVEGIVRVVDGVTVEADVALRAVAVIHRARGQQHQAGPVAAADRNFLDLLRFDQSADFGRRPVERFKRGRYFHRLGDGTDLQTSIDGARLADGQLDILELSGLEAIPRDGDGVRSHRQARHLVGTRRTGCGLAAETGGGRHRGDPGAWEHSFGWVRDGTVHRRVVDLRCQRQSLPNQEKERKEVFHTFKNSSAKTNAGSDSRVSWLGYLSRARGAGFPRCVIDVRGNRARLAQFKSVGDGAVN